MKQYIVILFFVFGYFSISAQIGLSTQYNTIQHPVWTEIFESSNLYDFEQGYTFPNTTGFGVDYWLHPFQYRIEFFPTLAYNKFTDSKLTIFDGSFRPSPDKFELTMIEFSVPTRIYPLDIEGECDCPTWGKDGSLIKKGFFIAGIVGLSQINLDTQYSEFSSNGQIVTYNYENNSTVFHAGIGTGLDIGINKYITLTPFVNYKVHFNAEGESIQSAVLANGVFFEDTNSNINQLQFGLRLGFQLKD